MKETTNTLCSERKLVMWHLGHSKDIFILAKFDTSYDILFVAMINNLLMTHRDLNVD